MQIALRFTWMLVSWLAVEVFVFLPLYIVGTLTFWIWSFAPVVAAPSKLWPDMTITAYKWKWLNEWLGNHEDGILPDWWVKEHNGTAFTWWLRNPVCNMRFWPVISTKPSLKTSWYGTLAEIPHDGTKGWFLAWNGPYSGFWWRGEKWGCWVGFKVQPRDYFGTPNDDYRRFGIGLASQLWRK